MSADNLSNHYIRFEQLKEKYNAEDYNHIALYKEFSELYCDVMQIEEHKKFPQWLLDRFKHDISCELSQIEEDNMEG